MYEIRMWPTLWMSLGLALCAEPGWACPLADEHAQQLNQQLIEACGARAPQWDLTEFVPDDEVCSGRQAALSLVQRHILELCTSISSDKRPHSLQQLQTLRARARLVTEFEFKREGRRLSMIVPIKEAPVLSNWNEHVERLSEFIGQPRPDPVDEGAGNSMSPKPSVQNSASGGAPRADQDREQEAERERERKRSALKAELEAVAKRFQLRLRTVWASPTSDPNEIARRQREVEQITLEFESEQKRVLGEMQNIK